MFDILYSKKLKVKRRFKEAIEPQEVLLDNLAQKQEFLEKKLESPFARKSFQWFQLVIILIFLLLFFKSFELQVIEADKFSEMAEDNRYISQSLNATRGIIYDKSLNQLVGNKPAFNLLCHRSKISGKESFEEINQILGKDVEQKIAESSASVIELVQDLDYKTLLILETRLNDFPCLEIEKNWQREYYDGLAFSHVLGYAGKITQDELEPPYSLNDWVGRTGLEKAYEDFLRKKSGEIRIERDARGNELSREIISLPEPGDSLVLWLDKDFQKKAKQLLDHYLRDTGSQKGVVIAMSPKTGGVLAMISSPSFNNNLFSGNISSEQWQRLRKDPLDSLFNRAISGVYPTGSTIKPLIASAALEEEIISPEKSIYDKGYIEIPHRYNPEIVYTFHDLKPHAWVDMRKAIAVSCNVYFYTIGGGYEDQEGLGPSLIKKYLELFGWAQKTGIDLPGEEQGLIPGPDWKKEVKAENWWDGDTYNLSIGQGDILATPLQIAVSFAVIANNGKLMEPHLAQKIIKSVKGFNADYSLETWLENPNNIIKEIPVNIVRDNFISQENLQIVREGMRQAVTSGSSALLNSLPVPTAAKTGTAQTPRKDVFHNWVTVFAPYEDPEIVLTVLVEDVHGIQAVVLPIARDILQWYFGREL